MSLGAERVVVFWLATAADGSAQVSPIADDADTGEAPVTRLGVAELSAILLAKVGIGIVIVIVPLAGPVLWLSVVRARAVDRPTSRAGNASQPRL